MAGIMPVVMAGGSGTRLWPLSKASTPKQFQPLVSEKTMLAETLARVTGDAFIEPAIIGSSQHRSLIEEHLQGGSILLEPCGKNTGPAALCAALLAAETSADQLILLLPADHYIADPGGFAKVVLRGQKAAQQGYLVTLGITPTAPETGYGYIKRGESLTDGTYTVEKFVEKPDRATAETYLQSEAYAWNAGIFLFRASDLLAEAETYAPA
ncbi:MAG: mannose-1-phosphate guanylyltransferase, partial [Pseudomonadota bacterium]